MTLKEWVALTGILPTHPTTERGAISLICPIEHPQNGALYHLSDYYVSTRSGAVLWLLPSLWNPPKDSFTGLQGNPTER